jgi:hypothetical protein
MTADTLIRLLEGTQRPGECRGCHARIVWVETLGGKRMPMNAGAVARKTETDPETRRPVGFYAAADSHWSTCPDANQFGRRR